MATRERHRLEIAGAVQGVGFRPLVYRVACEFGLAGWARNSLAGLMVEIEGAPDACAGFQREIRDNPPPNASVHNIRTTRLPVEGAVDFVIRDSEIEPSGAATEILPDLATCADCVREIFDPANRRFHYPFTNCTQCGPRFSIVGSLPWDRERTTMRGFEMCPACRAEFGSPGDRRFHAQPNACPECGPQLAFTDEFGRVLAERDEALESAARAIEAGRIVALKGIGGFQLFADARSAAAVETLRARKHRPAKPFALMLPNLEAVRAHCELSALEESLLTSARAPIVILRRLPGDELPPILAPGNPSLGVMLPYSPLHHLLTRRIGFPIVATSGNLSDEPLCIENDEAFRRLRGIADAFLIHDRPIARPVDDSVVRAAAGRELILRVARGYAPFSLGSALTPVLAVGGDQKAALAVSGPFGIRCGQHIGDLETEAALQAFVAQTRDFPELCGVLPGAVACDLHPGYHGARLAAEIGLPVVRVQHHHAHIAACLAEHDIGDEVLGVSWDGSGFGPDETIWGGEFLLATQADFERFAWLRPFPLPGGELSIRQPRYAALGLLHEAGVAVRGTPLAAAFTEEELAVARTQLERRIRTPLTSSAGRLFDAVAALAGLRWRNDFEAQAAMELEFAAGPDGSGFTPFEPRNKILDWEPAIRAVLAESNREVPVPTMAARFILAMSDAIVLVAHAAGKKTVVLSGGCFQNIRLLETTVARLREAGFTPVWPQLLPPNDGGLALGQAVVAARTLQSQHPRNHVPGDPR